MSVLVAEKESPKSDYTNFGHGVASCKSLSGRQIIMNTYLKELYLSMT